MQDTDERTGGKSNQISYIPKVNVGGVAAADAGARAAGDRSAAAPKLNVGLAVAGAGAASAAGTASDSAPKLKVGTAAKAVASEADMPL